MECVIIKLSGTVLDAPERLNDLVPSVLRYVEAGKKVVITHGGGVQISRLSEKLGVPVKQINGRRITDEATLDVLLYAVAGSLNTRLVHLLVQSGLKAVGLTGVDAGLTVSKRRPPQEINGEMIDFGLVGDLESVDVSLLHHLMKGDFIPVVACVTQNEDSPLNVNADTIANAFAVALKVSEMIVLMDVPSVLDAQKQCISEMDVDDFLRGKADGWIKDGMIPKLETCFASVKAGISRVRLASPESFKENGGTMLVAKRGGGKA